MEDKRIQRPLIDFRLFFAYVNELYTEVSLSYTLSSKTIPNHLQGIPSSSFNPRFETPSDSRATVE